MFDFNLFVREMARKDDQGDVARGLEQLWMLNYDVIQVVQPATNALVSFENDIIDAKMVFLNGTMLGRTREILLDTSHPTWQSDPADTPTSWIWNGEQNELLLYPTPDVDVELWIIVQRTPIVNYPKWFTLVAALRAVELLSLSDQVTGRAAMAKIVQPLSEAFYASTFKELQAKR